MASCSNVVQLIAGPQGQPGTNGTNGTDGVSSFTLLTLPFTMPAEGANATATVEDTSWIASGEVLYLQSVGYLEAQTITNATQVVLKNIEDTATLAYTDNVAPGTVAALGNKLSVGGLQGPAGASGLPLTTRGDIVVRDNAAANVRLPVGAASTVLGSDGSDPGWTQVSLTAAVTGILPIANGGTASATAAAARTALGLAIGTDVQAYNALLAALTTLAPTVADTMVYTTGVNTVTTAALTAFARTILDDADAAAARTTLGVLGKTGLLGSVTGVDLNVGATDTPITMVSANYIVTSVIVTNASINLTTATAGVFNAAAGAGPLAADQVLTALTASTKFLDATLGGVALTDLQTAATLYARCGTPQGAAATADFYVFGRRFD
jgi:hypothetical protein